MAADRSAPLAEPAIVKKCIDVPNLAQLAFFVLFILRTAVLSSSML